jgi:PAS domain S-box-containing protein
MDELMNTAPCGFVSFRDDGTVVEVNETLAELLHYTRVELLGWHLDKILPPGGRIFHHTYLLPLLKVKGSVEEIYLALRAKDGVDVPVLLNGARRERDGVAVNDCVCLRMIQRHEYEDQLLQARRLAEESSEAKAKFLSMMSHDLRTPLTAIYGNADLLAAGAFGSLNEEQEDAVRTIREACRTQMTMISDILDFARMEAGGVQVQPATIAVTEAITRAEKLIRVQVDEAQLRLLTTACEADVSVVADPNRLQQILLNLLTNAVKFTPPRGTIEVSCANEGNRVRIRVRDSGIGIAAEQLSRIFSPFVQLDPAGASVARVGGVGLGLAISRDLARAMGGDVTAESTPGNGSVFTIDLPSAPSVAKQDGDPVAVA